MFGVYIIRSCKDGSLYTGYSADVKKRFAEHNKGVVRSTCNRRSLEMLFCELYKNKEDALQRERFFKTGWGRNYVKKILHYTLKEKIK